MQFEVLGPLRVREGNRPITLTAPMPRTLLAILLCRPNTPVPVDVLADLLWSGEEGVGTSKRLQLHVHRLRRALGDPARIRFEHGAYTLRVDPGELDAERFDALLAEAADAAYHDDVERSAELGRAALSLWRGEPFTDVAGVPLVRSQARRLVERRLTGLEELYAAELASGRAGIVAAELGELAARHPLRERLQALLMSALHRLGRRAEALEVYRHTRARLVDELGLEPGDELRRFERAVRAGEPASEVVPAAIAAGAPTGLPPDVPDFTGRVAQLDALCELLAPRAGPAEAPVIVVIAGIAGVGKSALAVHAAHRLRGDFPDGQLHADLRGAGAHPLDPAEVLARFLRVLGVPGSAIPVDLEERASLYRSRIANRHMFVLLDNAESEAQLRPLFPGARGCAVLVTSRIRMAGFPGVRLVDLGVLSSEHAVDLLGRVVGAERIGAEPEAARRIVDLCGHLPLAVHIAGARLAHQPNWTSEQLAERLTDEHARLDGLVLGDLDVRASVGVSYHGLRPEEQRAFRLLGLVPAPDFAAWVVAALLQVPTATGEALVEALAEARLLDALGPDGTGQQRYRFHDLLRVFAAERVTSDEPDGEQDAARLRALGGWLRLAQQAERRLCSTAFGVQHHVCSPWEPEPELAGALLADPLAWFEAERVAALAAAEQAFSVGADAITLGFSAALAPFYVVRGYHDDWRRICELGLAAARRSGLRRAEGGALRGLGELSWLQRRLGDALHRFECAHMAFEEVGDRHGSALASSGIGAVHREAGRLDEALTHLERAAVTLSELGDHQSLGWTLRRLGDVHQVQGRYDHAIECYDEALRHFRELREPVAEASVLEGLGATRMLQGCTGEAWMLLDRSLALHREHAEPFGEARALTSLGELHRTEGRPGEAIECLRGALRIWRDLGLPDQQAKALREIGTIHAAAGERDDARSAWSPKRRFWHEGN